MSFTILSFIIVKLQLPINQGVIVKVVILVIYNHSTWQLFKAVKMAYLDGRTNILLITNQSSTFVAMSSDIKKQLYEACKLLSQNKIDTIKESIKAAQEAANSETKSTAGDKHDTARAMMQLEVEQKSRQLQEAEKLKQGLAQFDEKSGSSEIGLGTLVTCSSAAYYISISIGKLEIEGEMYFAVSPISPVAQALMGKKMGEHFEMNGKQIKIIGAC